MSTEGMIKALEFMGASEEQIKRIKNISLKPEDGIKKNIKEDLSSATIEEMHNKALSYMKKTLSHFENCDVVECDNSLLNENMIDAMWKNIHIYSYDMENFFLNECVLYLKDKDKVLYKIYFSLEKDNIFLYVENEPKTHILGGAVTIKDGKFIPSGVINDNYYKGLSSFHKANNMPFDRNFVANRNLLNCLLYLLVINQMFNMNKEVITETSRRVDITKKKKSNKKVQKRTKQIRYIKVDNVKVQRIKEQIERESREKYNRHVSEWSRRGYWTTLRNGKKHWVKPTTCYAKDKVENKVENKIYKLV